MIDLEEHTTARNGLAIERCADDLRDILEDDHPVAMALVRNKGYYTADNLLIERKGLNEPVVSQPSRAVGSTTHDNDHSPGMTRHTADLPLKMRAEYDDDYDSEVEREYPDIITSGFGMDIECKSKCLTCRKYRWNGRSGIKRTNKFCTWDPATAPVIDPRDSDFATMPRHRKSLAARKQAALRQAERAPLDSQPSWGVGVSKTLRPRPRLCNARLVYHLTHHQR